MAKRTVSTKYADLLNKLATVKQDSPFWKPEVGMNIIRILPEVNTMDFFFVQSGRHYLGGSQSYDCAKENSEGKDDCPLCDVNEAMYQAGDIPNAKKWRVSKTFLFNVIVRGKESEGPKIYSSGSTIFNMLAALISDPDVGDVTDIEDGFDLKLERTGEGLETRYTLRESRNPTPLGTEDEIEEWLANATDLALWVAERIPDYNETAKASGAAVILGMDMDDYDEAEDEEVEDETETISASDRIRSRIDRKGSRNLSLSR